MMGLIKHLKISMVLRSGMHHALMLEKMLILKGLAISMGWILSFSILSQVLFNRMVMLNGNLPLFSKGCMS